MGLPTGQRGQVAAAIGSGASPANRPHEFVEAAHQRGRPGHRLGLDAIAPTVAGEKPVPMAAAV
jgi:hypothetical protein